KRADSGKYWTGTSSVSRVARTRGSASVPMTNLDTMITTRSEHATNTATSRTNLALSLLKFNSTRIVSFKTTSGVGICVTSEHRRFNDTLSHCTLLNPKGKPRWAAVYAVNEGSNNRTCFGG